MSVVVNPSSCVRLIAALASAGAVACGGGDGTGSTQGTGGAPVEARPLAPAAFAEVARDPSTFVLNVHVPYAGSIPGTDAEIPFDRIEARRRELPSRTRRVAVYCRTGAMSAVARRTLARLGYRRTVELRGGMEAWTASGRRLRR